MQSETRTSQCQSSVLSEVVRKLHVKNVPKQFDCEKTDEKVVMIVRTDNDVAICASYPIDCDRLLLRPETAGTENHRKKWQVRD